MYVLDRKTRRKKDRERERKYQWIAASFVYPTVHTFPLVIVRWKLHTTTYRLATRKSDSILPFGVAADNLPLYPQMAQFNRSRCHGLNQLSMHCSWANNKTVCGRRWGSEIVLMNLCDDSKSNASTENSLATFLSFIGLILAYRGNYFVKIFSRIAYIIAES